MRVTPGDLRRMREAGWSYREIAKISGLPWSTIRSRCRSLNITSEVKIYRSRNRKHKYEDKITKDLLELMYIECQLSATEIAYELDVNRSTLLKLIHHYDIPVRTKRAARLISLQRDGASPPPPHSHE